MNTNCSPPYTGSTDNDNPFDSSDEVSKEYLKKKVPDYVP